jgi:hypothetical protein
MSNESDRTQALIERIKQLGEKSTQVLLFLSFAFVAVVAMKSDHTISESQQRALTIAMRLWVVALPLILFGVLPVRDAVDYAENKVPWYEFIRWCKVALLIGAVVLILGGAWFFACGIWPVAQSAGVPQNFPLD